MRCYNCGKGISRKEKTKEHIPAQALFVGYDKEFKYQRITVPACSACNLEFSRIDNELRDAIGVTNNDTRSKSAMELSGKSVKSILKQKKGQKRLFFNPNGNVIAVQFDYEKFKKAVIKDFKGIFFREFGFPFPSDYWKVEIVSDFEDDEKLKNAAADIYRYLEEGIDWEASGHQSIFKYKFKTMAHGKNGVIYDTIELDDAINIACVQMYHERMGFIVLASRKTFLSFKFPLLQFRKKRK